jgi:predicted dehydrogenase
MIRIGIVGCGKIADDHAEQIRRIAGCEIVGVCDREELMARQLAERYNVKHYHGDVNELLETSRPEIVHITTPPQNHFELGRQCLEAGCHVYIEKPFTLNTEEAEKLITLAEEKSLKITVGHDSKFMLATRRMRELIKNGYLGGTPVHIESYFCYDFGDRIFARALLEDKEHWVRKLPGGLLQNIISHGISKITEFMLGDNPQVIAHGFSSHFLKELGEADVIDELRVIINDNDRTTAYFTFSSQLRPVLHQVRIYGPKNAIIVDDDNQTLIKVRGPRYKSYLDKFVPPYVYARQYLGCSLTNIHHFLKRDFQMREGLKFLIESFYRSVTRGAPLPISYAEIILIARIMDSIFQQLDTQKRTLKT